MESRHETPLPASLAGNQATSIPLGERVVFLVIGFVIGMVFEAVVRLALGPVLGPTLSKGIGRGIAVGTVLCFINGYPRPTWRWAITTQRPGIAAGLLASWLVD